jgi:hypothetical protein
MMFRAVFWVVLWDLMMEAVRTSETSVDNHFTRQYNPEDSSEHHYDYSSYQDNKHNVTRQISGSHCGRYEYENKSRI